MRRRELLGALGGGTVAWPLGAFAQQQRIRVVGFLGAASQIGFAPEVAAFQEGLRETGWVVGQNVTIEYRWAEGRFDRLASLAAELVNRNVDVIAVSGGVLPARAAKDATGKIPIVFEIGVDPAEAGLVASFARPGGNLTGITIATGELNPKRLELLSELVPLARVIAMLVNPNNPRTAALAPAVQQAARAKGIELALVSAGNESDFETAFGSLARSQTGALLVGNDPFFYSRREQLVMMAARHAVPAMYEWREFVALGGLASYGTSLTRMYRRFGVYVGRVLAGANPGDLPVEQPTKFELVLNLKTARALGIAVPQSLLARADEVIE